MVLKNLSYKTKHIISGFIQILLGLFAIFVLKHKFYVIIIFLILALLDFANVLFGKDPADKPKKYSEKVYRNRQIFSTCVGLVLLFMALIELIDQPRSGLGLVYMESGLLCVLFP